MQDIYSTIKDQYGVDPKEGLNPNSFQQVLIAEAELGEITPETLNNSISSLEAQIGSEQDPKMQKELQKKLENLKKVAERPKKEISMDLENKWSKNFGEVDNLIGTLDAKSKSQLLTNVFINENPKWHPERNSFVHIKIVCSRGIDTKDEDLMYSALYHDIAKFDTATFNAQGWPTCLGHDKKGADSAKAAGMNDTVVYVCANHMKVKGWQGDSEGGTLNPSTKFQIFAEAPGQTSDEKAKAFYKLCVFSKMDNMAYDFNAEKLNWKNPTYEKWNEECPLKDEFKKEELVEIKVEKAKPTFTSQELMAFGAKGPQIGEINKAIVGKTKEEAFEIIKQILGNPELKMESKKWIMTFESFRKNKQIDSKIFEGNSFTGAAYSFVETSHKKLSRLYQDGGIYATHNNEMKDENHFICQLLDFVFEYNGETFREQDGVKIPTSTIKIWSSPSWGFSDDSKKKYADWKSNVFDGGRPKKPQDIGIKPDAILENLPGMFGPDSFQRKNSAKDLQSSFGNVTGADFSKESLKEYRWLQVLPNGEFLQYDSAGATSTIDRLIYQIKKEMVK